MHSSISRDDLQILLHEADSAARRLVRQLRLPRTELNDIRQDLLVDLLTRLSEFDPERGSLGAFAGLVARNRATRIANKVKRERQIFGANPVSLDDPRPDHDGASRGDTIAEEDGLAAFFGQPVDAFAQLEQRLDVERALGGVGRDDGVLCAALTGRTVSQLAQAGCGARASLYRRVKAIRMAFLAQGVSAR